MFSQLRKKPYFCMQNMTTKDCPYCEIMTIMFNR